MEEDSEGRTVRLPKPDKEGLPAGKERPMDRESERPLSFKNLEREGRTKTSSDEGRADKKPAPSPLSAFAVRVPGCFLGRVSGVGV